MFDYFGDCYHSLSSSFWDRYWHDREKYYPDGTWWALPTWQLDGYHNCYLYHYYHVVPVLGPIPKLLGQT